MSLPDRIKPCWMSAATPSKFNCAPPPPPEFVKSRQRCSRYPCTILSMRYTLRNGNSDSDTSSGVGALWANPVRSQQGNWYPRINPVTLRRRWQIAPGREHRHAF